MRICHRRALALLLLSAAGAGCATSVRNSVEGERSEEQRATAEVKFNLNADEGRIARGRDAAARGEYDAALVQFDVVYGNPKAAPELRAQALYQSALVHSNALNPHRDLAEAQAAARKLIAEFPQSQWRDDAETLLAKLERQSP